MARIAGVDIPRDKRVQIALTYIYGVGRTSAVKTLEETGIDGSIRVKDLSDDQLVCSATTLKQTSRLRVTSAVRLQQTSAAR